MLPSSLDLTFTFPECNVCHMLMKLIKEAESQLSWWQRGQWPDEEENMFAHSDLPLLWKQLIWALGDSESKDEGCPKEARCHLVRVLLHARRKEPGCWTTDASRVLLDKVKLFYSAVFLQNSWRTTSLSFEIMRFFISFCTHSHPCLIQLRKICICNTVNPVSQSLQK